MPKRKKLRKKYEVRKVGGKKYIVISVRGIPYPSLADMLQIVGKEFRGVPRRDLTFSTDNDNLYLGNDKLPEEE